MFVFIATERFYRRAAAIPSPDSPPAVLPAKPPEGADAARATPPLALDGGNVPAGTRYQLLRALRAMAKGGSMVVERRIPSLADHFDNPGRRESWFASLRSISSWLDTADVEPILVPGTAFPALVGRILLRNGWAAPSGTPHWVPNLRFFKLTEVGYQAFAEAQAWWRALTPAQRLRLVFVE